MPIAVLKIIRKMITTMTEAAAGWIESKVLSMGTSEPVTSGMRRRSRTAAVTTISAHISPPKKPPQRASRVFGRFPPITRLMETASIMFMQA